MKIRRTNKLIFIAVALLAAVFFYFFATAKYLTPEKDLNISSPFGVLEFLHWNHSWNHSRYASKKDLIKALNLMKQAGVGWVRFDFVWGDIENKPNEFDFAKYDYIVDLLNKNNLNILGILDYSATWAAVNGLWNSPPKDNKLFVNFLTKVIGRYKDKIKYWEIWNEPDSYTYWTKQDGLKSYCALLKESYIAAKKIDSDCKILNGGLANGLASVNHLYDNGCRNYFDILNIHIFYSPLNPNAIKAVEAYPKLCFKVMSRNGDAAKKIWITEIGCPGVNKGLYVKNWWLGQNPNEHEQAGWLKLIYSQLLNNETIEKIFWAFFRDTKNHWLNGIDDFGIVRWDFSKKPAFQAYRQSFENWKKSGKSG